MGVGRNPNRVNINLPAISIQWEREMGANLGSGPGNVLATPRGEEKGKGLIRAGWGQDNLGMVKVMVKVLDVKVLVASVTVNVLGTKVHVSTAIKLDIKQQSAQMHELLRFLRLGQKSKLVVVR